MDTVIITTPEENVAIEDELTEKQKSQRLVTHFVDTFGYQRQFLNNLSFPPSASNIIHVWPILLNLTFYFAHHEMLTGASWENWKQKLNRVRRYLYMDIAKTKVQWTPSAMERP